MHKYRDILLVDKSKGREGFDENSWRRGLAGAAAAALQNRSAACPAHSGPFEVQIRMRDGRAAAAAAKRWGLAIDGECIRLAAADISVVYLGLIRICYLSPLTERCLRPSLFLYRLLGRAGWQTVRFAQALGLENR